MGRRRAWASCSLFPFSGSSFGYVGCSESSQGAGCLWFCRPPLLECFARHVSCFPAAHFQLLSAVSSRRKTPATSSNWPQPFSAFLRRSPRSFPACFDCPESSHTAAYFKQISLLGLLRCLVFAPLILPPRAAGSQSVAWFSHHRCTPATPSR